MEESTAVDDLPCLDMDGDPEQTIMAPSISQFETIYVTSHKGPCRAGCFSPDAKLIATGSADASIKILDVERMISKSTSHQQQLLLQQQQQQQQLQQQLQQQNNDTNDGQSGTLLPSANNELLSNNDNQDSNDVIDSSANNNAQSQQQQSQNQSSQNQQNSNNTAHPVIRTLYDHAEEVTYLQFHPTAPILASGSSDMTIKFYDYMRASAKRAHKTIQEASPIRCFTFHPSGTFMLVGCQQPTLRLYDVNTLQSFVSSNPLDQHNESITMIDYNSTASFYVTGSKDGDIKVWDGVSNRCVNTMRRAHEGSISSVKVSRNGKYILSSGKDSSVKLWEMSMSSCLMSYDGASSGSSSKKHRAQAVFNHTEDYVFFPDGRNTSLHVWNAHSGKHLETLPLCHNNSVRFLTHSAVGPSFLTCSEDFRARFWSIRDKDSITLKIT